MILPLPCGRVVLLDDADWPIVAPYRWFAAQQASGQVYARGERYRGAPRVYMHRLIAGVTDPARLVDHWSGNGLHNWRSNLRVCTVAQNNCNVRRRSRRKAFKGVYRTDSGKYFAEITANGRRHRARGFATDAEAAAAYDALALALHGEFARLNLPQESA